MEEFEDAGSIFPSMSPSNFTDTNGIEENGLIKDRYLVSSLSMYAYGMIFGFSLLFFGFAVHYEWIDNLTPRIANRPRAVLKNAMFHPFPSWLKCKFSPLLYPIAWIFWAYNLSYKDCLKGIPGTGTRKDGKEGPLLKVNLDGIIFLRFHVLLFKVSVLVAFLCTCLILPINWTARCDSSDHGEAMCLLLDESREFSRFQATTIANIPGIPHRECVNNSLKSGGDASVCVNKYAVSMWFPDQSWRIWVIVISCLIIYLYIAYLLYWEWIENVELRRKYFLEGTHYSQRKGELQKLAIHTKKRSNRITTENNNIYNCSESNEGQSSYSRQETHENNRPEYLTHPEIRETPPSIGVYSVLYRLPKFMVTCDTDGVTTIERQLVATRNFFDEIIPPSSGFSSSVAAVTILPNSKLVSKARKKWGICVEKIQRLRYIRKKLRIAENKREEYERKEQEQQKKLRTETNGYQREDSVKLQEPLEKSHANNDDEIPTKLNIGNGSNNYDPKTLPNSSNVKIIGARINPDGSIESMSSGEKSLRNGEQQCKDNLETPKEIEIPDILQSKTETLTAAENPLDSSENAINFRYKHFNVSEYAASIGFREEVHEMAEFVDGMGVEEFNVFAYECALIAGSSLNISHKFIKRLGIETLREDEKNLLEELRVDNLKLLKARKDVALFADETEFDGSEPLLNPSIPCDDEGSTIEHYGECERAGNLSVGIRRRNITGREDGNIAVTSDDDRDNHQEIESWKLSILQRVWGLVEFLLIVPKRIYRGKDASVSMKEPRKYYGNVDMETGHSGYVTSVDHPSYAVVTFTTRYAAVIARQCLADGAPRNHWAQVDDIPIYPLADGSPAGIGRPVTPTISYESKKIRFWIVIVVFLAMTVAYTFILNLIHSVTGGKYSTLITDYMEIAALSIASPIFLILGNINGSATSVGRAEYFAMFYLWYFYILSRFVAQIIGNISLRDLATETDGTDATDVIEYVFEYITEYQQFIPKILGPSAFTYIMSYSLQSWPVSYFLNGLNFATALPGLGWINRFMRGGGPGAVVPYRIYIDSGYVLACMTILAPLCPLVGTASLLYFIIVQPILRWLIVFSYRPNFDGGGQNWPMLHHIIVSSMMIGQVITGLSIFGKGNVVEACIILSTILPTLWFSIYLRSKFYRPYQDAALLQTIRMYSGAGDASVETYSFLEREDYRCWLVDCHKASYLPTCLSGGENNILTAEPAIVMSEGMTSVDDTAAAEKGTSSRAQDSVRSVLKHQKCQKGRILRRHRYSL